MQCRGWGRKEVRGTDVVEQVVCDEQSVRRRRKAIRIGEGVSSIEDRTPSVRIEKDCRED